MIMVAYLAYSLTDATREAAFASFKAEFTRNGVQVTEGLVRLLRNFSSRAGETPDAARARLYYGLWQLFWFGSKKTLGSHVTGGLPTYVFPASLKLLIRETVPRNLVDQPDPDNAKVYKVTIADLAAARCPAVKKKK